MNFYKGSYQPILRYLYTEALKRQGEISLHKHFNIQFFPVSFTSVFFIESFFPGVDTKMESDDEFEHDYDEAGDESKNNDNESTTTSESVAANKNEQRTFGETKEDTAHPPPISAGTRGGNPAPNIPHLSDLVNKFSELIVGPIESHLKDLVSKTELKPELLIIPQGQTFNIPYSTLRLENGQPLCSLVAPREAFSFHSYYYSTTLQQEATSHVNDEITK